MYQHSVRACRAAFGVGGAALHGRHACLTFILRVVALCAFVVHAPAFAQAGVGMDGGTLTGTIGTNKGAVQAVQCPGGTVLSGVRHVDKGVNAFPSAFGMTSQLGLYCSRIATDGVTVTATMTTAAGTPVVAGTAYPDPGTVRNAYCPAGQVAHRMGGWDRDTAGFPWTSAIRLVCRPLTLNANDWIRIDTGTAGTNADAGVLEANAAHVSRGPFCSNANQTTAVSGYHRQDGGQGYDGVNIYCGNLQQARFSAAMTFTDFAWSQVLGGAGWLVDLRQGAAVLNDGGANNGTGKTPHAGAGANTSVFQAANEIYVLPGTAYNAAINQRPAGIASAAFLATGSCLTGITPTSEQDASCSLAIQGLPDIAVGITPPASTYRFHGQQANVVVTATNLGPGATDGDDGFTLVTTLPSGWTAGTLPANCVASGGGTVVTCALNPSPLAGSAAPGTNGGSVSFNLPVIVNAPTSAGTYTATISLGRAAPDADADATNHDYVAANDTASGPLVYAPQPAFGACDGRMFLDQVDKNQNPNVSELLNVGYASAPFTYSSLGTGFARNAIGYNPLDNYIYGIEWDGSLGNELLRVGADGSSVNLGVVTGLPSANYAAGVVAPNGDYYVTAGGTILYRVNLATRTATAITLSTSITVFDLVWYSGTLYSVNTAGQLISINPATGAITSIGSSAPLNAPIAMWGFTNGLFAYNDLDNRIYAIDPVTGVATLISSAPITSNADGANCPAASIRFDADLAVTKTNTPASGPSDLLNDTYVPGAVRTYTLVVTNGSTSFGAQNITVNDPVPSGIAAATVSWTCASTSGGARCGAASGAGALNDTGLDLPPGAVATYQVTMTVPAGFTGDLTNTVTVAPPGNINDGNAANNSATDTDPRTPLLTIRKTSLGGVGSFGFTGTNGTATQTLTTITAGTPQPGARQALTAASTATTITESTSPSTYRVTNITCTGLGAGGTATPDLANRSVALDAAATAAGSDIVCTFTNTLQQADLQVVKTASPNPVVSGDVVTYTLVVTNNGPNAVTNAVLSDVASSGQTCTVAATCTATGGATCPSPTVPAATLLGGGMTIPNLPMGGQVTVVLPCTVTASGAP